MNATERNSARAEPEFLHLGEIEHEIFTRRTRQGKPVFRDPEAFSEQLHALAQKYVDRRVIVQDKYSRHRYRSVEKAALQLQEALSNLRADELESLGRKQDHCFSAYCSELARNESLDDSLAPDVYGDPIFPIRADCLLMSHTLIWLRAGAEQLSKPKKKGRPSNSLEFWVAREFVMLCLNEGWSLTVSSSAYDRKSATNASDSVESDSIRCLAAVYAKARIHPLVCLRYAKTELRKFRKRQIHEQWDDDYGESTVEVDLKQMRSHFDLGISDDMPNFIPQTR